MTQHFPSKARTLPLPKFGPPPPPPMPPAESTHADHAHPYDPDCHICRRFPSHDTWPFVASAGPNSWTGDERVETFGRLDPDPLHVEPLDCDGLPFCPTGSAQRYHAIGECDCPKGTHPVFRDTDRGTWLGCAVVIAVALLFFIAGRLTS